VKSIDDLTCDCKVSFLPQYITVDHSWGNAQCSTELINPYNYILIACAIEFSIKVFKLLIIKKTTGNSLETVFDLVVRPCNWPSRPLQLDSEMRKKTSMSRRAAALTLQNAFTLHYIHYLISYQRLWLCNKPRGLWKKWTLQTIDLQDVSFVFVHMNIIIIFYFILFYFIYSLTLFYLHTSRVYDKWIKNKSKNTNTNSKILKRDSLFCLLL